MDRLNNCKLQIKANQIKLNSEGGNAGEVTVLNKVSHEEALLCPEVQTLKP